MRWKFEGAAISSEVKKYSTIAKEIKLIKNLNHFPKKNLKIITRVTFLTI